jgi:response regulator RpfG family c-di-GMP phosphodiesterase
MKILLVEDQPELREIFAIFLEMQFGADVVTASHGDEAINILKNNQTSRSEAFDLIISDYSMPRGNGEDLHRYLVEAGLKIPFILVSAEERSQLGYFETHPIAGIIQKPDIRRPLKELVEKILPPEKRVRKKQYCKISIHTLLKTAPLEFDLHIQLSPNKWVKVIPRGDWFDATQLLRFENKKIDHLYVTQDDADRLLNQITESISSNPLPAGEQRRHELFERSSVALAAISDITRTLGFNEAAQKLAHASVSMAVSAIEEDPNIAGMFADLTRYQENYFSSHSLALAYIACGVASLHGWTSDNTFYKLTLSAFLHDLTLGQSSISEYQTLKDLKASSNHSDLPSVKAFTRHPHEAAKLSAMMKNANRDVFNIIAQHHERPDGSGFPHQIDYKKIAPLSAIFIMSHA